MAPSFPQLTELKASELCLFSLFLSIEPPIYLSDFSLLSIPKTIETVWDFIRIPSNNKTLYWMPTQIMLCIEGRWSFLSHNLVCIGLHSKQVPSG